MSNHHLHHVTGYAVALAEMKEFGKAYAGQIVKNARALAEALHESGFDVLCEHLGFTKSHQVAVDVSKIGGGNKIALDFEAANMIINKNLFPWDSLTQTANPSGIRIGVQEITRVGMKEKEMAVIAGFMERVALKGRKPGKVREDVEEFKREFNTVRYCFDEGEGDADVGAM